ncbi:MAG: phospholipase D-like domain-containing protein [Gammaproteobacteria bacterium]
MDLPEELEKNYRRPLERAVGDIFVPGNNLRVLQNGIEIFPPMLEAINSAEEYVALVTYVYWRGDIAGRFAEALANAAERGVRTRVLLDSHGCRTMDDRHLQRMENAGVEIRWFRPLATFRLWRIDNRTHRKLLICDNDTAFTGGVGIADEWDGDARNPNEWRDTHVRVRGPAVRQLHAAFMDNWCEAGDWEYDFTEGEPPFFEDGAPVMTVRSDSTVDWTNIAMIVRTMIEIARSEISLTTAYLAPDPAMVRLLAKATKRGVRVRILAPGPYTDSRLSQLAGGPAVETLLDAGVEVLWYQKTMLHAKVGIVDGCASLIGSPNLNHRSMGKDEECCIVVLSPALANQLGERFDADCRDAVELDAESWANRGGFRKFEERAARIIHEQL